jgi:hypothetical protein
MTLEGANVKLVCEIMPYSGGSERNIQQCLRDFDIPLMLNTTVTRVVGKPRVSGVYIAEVDENRRIKEETEKFVPCDCLLLSVGLIPENELASPLGLEMSNVTNGAVVNEYRSTSLDGFFACGNALHVHDLVDNVSVEAHIAGRSAGLYALGKLPQGNEVKISTKNGIRYTVPQKLTDTDGIVTVYFRAADIYENVKVVAKCGDAVISSKKYVLLKPGEMSSLTVDKEKVTGELTICVE